MKKYITIIALALFACTMTAQDLYKDALYPTGTVLKFRKEIALSESQVTNLKKITEDNDKAFNALKLNFDAAQVALKKILETSKIDEIRALEQLKKINIMESEMKFLRLKMLINIKNELSEEQQKKLKKIIFDSDSKTSKGWNVTTGINKDPRIVIRDSATKDGKSPMYIIIDKNGETKYLDGKAEVKVKNIEPDNIESVNVIKGKAAIAKYGKEGKNGVIVIKLKE